MRKAKILVGVCVSIVLALSVAVMNAARPKAYTTAEAIECAFEAMELKDARFVGEKPISELYEDVCLLYTSEEAHMAFYFDPGLEAWPWQCIICVHSRGIALCPRDISV